MRLETQSAERPFRYHRVWCTSITASLLVLASLMIPLLCSRSSEAASSSTTPLKIGFIMVGPMSDWGWNYQHNQGRLFLEKAMPGLIETTVAENIPENAEVERVMEKMIAKGNKLIFATSYGYLEPGLRVAARHPNVIIMHCGRPNPNVKKNFGSYGTDFTNHYGPMYMAGIVAGRMTKKHNIGYVAAHPVPPLLLTLNAFTLGARSVNPKVKVHIVWTNNWCDPPTEAEAAKGLIDAGADVLAAHMDSTVTVVQTAEKYGLYSVGYHADIHHLAPKGWLTSEWWDWGPVYVKIVKSIKDHTWKPGDNRDAIKYNYGKLSTIGKAVPNTVRQEALALQQRLEKGEFVVFKGPLQDRDGKERVAAGHKLENKNLENINWVVAGVEGSLPRK